MDVQADSLQEPLPFRCSPIHRPLQVSNLKEGL